MRRVLVSVLLAISLFVISFQFSSILNPDIPAQSSNLTQSTVFSPNIDPIKA